MELEVPEFIRQLCAADAIFPFSHYVRRTPWELRKEQVIRTFLDRMGLYCFWWTGPRQVLLDRIAVYRYGGEPYPGPSPLTWKHDLIPTYVGMTPVAARYEGSQLKGRIVDRLVRFPTGMKRWLTSRKEARLIQPLTGTSGNFALFDYAERIRVRLAAMASLPDLSLADAQQYLDTHQDECRGLIEEFHEDYCSLMFDNYSISFVPFTDEAELFYAEALAIGVLRPCLNHS